ncbi:MAG: hypothetical protein ACYC6Y_29590 [Thermoguttaceae bacterium]
MLRGMDGVLADAAQPGPMSRLYFEHGSALDQGQGSCSMVYLIRPEKGERETLA